MNENLQKAIDIVGGQSQLAKKLRKAMKNKCSQSMVNYWLHDAKSGVPAEYCPALEMLTGIPKVKFRPDVYGGKNA
jgi:DNA-binding transcriptional regulator YdaS (Cro superfamily)